MDPRHRAGFAPSGGPLDQGDIAVDTRTNPCGRCVRAALALLLAGAHFAHAQAVYKCRDAQGHVAYQDRACPGAATQTQVALAPAPEPAPSPEYSASARPAARTGARRTSTGSRRARAPEATSYECRAGNGEVFYRHGACPKSIRIGDSRGSGSRRGAAAPPVAVSALAMPRSEACRRMHASAGRSGHARDDAVSTYERNLGRDPCR